MKKITLAALAAAFAMAAAPAVADPVVAVWDPTPTGTFSGTYAVPDDPNTEEDESQTPQSQTGYVGVYENGIVACNGNQELTRPDDGTPLQGYIWVGGNAASNPTAKSPDGPGGNSIGAGNNHENEDGSPTGDSPCPDAAE